MAETLSRSRLSAMPPARLRQPGSKPRDSAPQQM